MASPKIIGAQRDFSAGEIDPIFKRADDNPIMKAGMRQLSNWRIRNSRSIINRPGRTALFLFDGRVDEVVMSPDNTFYLAFGAGTIKVYNAAGAQVFTSAVKGDGTTVIPWTLATVKSIVWDVYKYAIYITYGDDFPLNVPQVLTWDGVSQTSAWTLTTYTEQVYGGIQKRVPFYRLSPLNVTMVPSATTGAITVTFSSPILTAAHVGTRMRYVNKQFTITSLVSASVANAVVNDNVLYNGNILNNASGASCGLFFQVGDLVIGQLSGAKGIVISYSGASMTVQPLSSTDFGAAGAEVVVGPNGSLGFNTVTDTVPQPITVWDDEVINDFRGYPRSCFVDQGRLGFNDVPAEPSMIIWSAFGVFTDLYTDANNVAPDNAIIEIAPAKSRVFFVVAGPESSEFVFCDNAIYYIPITANNPLKPGSVAFNLLSSDGSAPIKPRIVQVTIVWVNAGLTSVLAVVAPGFYFRPYEIRNLTEFHSHLVNNPICLAAPNSTDQFEERYVYLLNSDGTIAVGKYEVENGQIKGLVGWLPWTGAGASQWILSYGCDVVFSSRYAPNGITAVGVIEKLDETEYLDGAMAVNAAPAAFTPPGGKGPLWWLAGGSVELMDQVTRMMGIYQIDADGNLVPQFVGGEDLTVASLIAGQSWTAIAEPFAPEAPPGQSYKQRAQKRRVARMVAYVVNSTGFLFARLFSGPLTPTSLALGAIMNTRRVTTWNQDDDPTKAPPLREEVQRWRPIGRSYDPRTAIIKDTPGPLEIPEIGIEASV